MVLPLVQSERFVKIISRIVNAGIPAYAEFILTFNYTSCLSRYSSYYPFLSITPIVSRIRNTFDVPLYAH